MPSPRSALVGLAWVRIVLGVFTWLFPGLANRLFFVPKAHDSHSLTYMNRIFGIRAVALGLSYLTADEQRQATINRIWLLVDGADTVMGAHMAATGKLTKAQAAELLTVTGGATVVDAAGLLARR